MSKRKNFNIKINPPHRSRGDTIRGCNVGFEPKYRQRTEGIGQSLQDRKDSIRKYSDAWDRIFGKKETA